jgi:hypothetical protein
VQFGARITEREVPVNGGSFRITPDLVGMDFLLEGMHVLVLQSCDLQRSAQNLAARGVGVHTVADSPDLVEIERASTFGARIWIEPA